MQRVAGYCLLFLMLAFPMALSLLYVKAALFGVLLLVLVVRLLSQRPLNLHPCIAIGSAIFAIIGLFFCLEGILRGTPGATQCAQVYVFWPLIYTFLLTGINKDEIFSGLEKTMVFATVFIGLFGILFFFSALHLIPDIPFAKSLLSDDEISSGFYESHVELAFPGLNSLPFLVPFVLGVAVTRKEKRFWPWAALCASLPIVILSGRRALQIVTVLAPLLVYLFCRFQPRAPKKPLSHRLIRSVAIAVIVAVISFFSLQLFSDLTAAGLKQRLFAGFDFADTTNARTEQFHALTESIFQHPLLGFGFGAANYHSVRSVGMPWAYELFYVALVFQTGILGFTAYALGMVWVYRSATNVIRSGNGERLISIMVGMTALLIATATNPYLVRFDGLWAIFLAIAHINYSLIRRSKLSRGELAIPLG